MMDIVTNRVTKVAVTKMAVTKATMTKAAASILVKMCEQIGILRRLAIGSTFALSAMLLSGLAGCDYVAQKELKVGQSSKEDVIVMMGKPEMIWEEKDGSFKYEYPRGPVGTETFMVDISPDGKYLGMNNVLTEANFARIKAGMTRDDVRRLLGKPTETAKFPLKQEETWTWKFKGTPTPVRRFHVNMDFLGVIKTTDQSDDPMEGRAP